MKIRFLSCCAAALCLSISSAFSQVTSNQIYRGLISYWPMDALITNGSVVTTPDVVSGINLTAAGGPALVSDPFSNAISLNGTSQYLENVQAAAGTNNLATGLPYFAERPFTIAMWVYAPPQSGPSKCIFAMANSTTSRNPPKAATAEMSQM